MLAGLHAQTRGGRAWRCRRAQHQTNTAGSSRAHGAIILSSIANPHVCMKHVNKAPVKRQLRSSAEKHWGALCPSEDDLPILELHQGCERTTLFATAIR